MALVDVILRMLLLFFLLVVEYVHACMMVVTHVCVKKKVGVVDRVSSFLSPFSRLRSVSTF